MRSLTRRSLVAPAIWTIAVFALVLTSTVGLHWHAHVGADTLSQSEAHLADISTPHFDEEGDRDVRLTGDDAFSPAMFPAINATLTVIAWLLPLAAISDSRLHRAIERKPPSQRHLPHRLPLLRAPPQ